MSWNIGLKDKIGALSHSAGIISLQPSLLTIGGRQYKTTSVLTRTISADVTMTANSLYMIYAQIVSGVVALRISASVRSSYLLLNPQSELVGAFYASGVAVVDFGSFVKIYGSITTDPVQYTPTLGAGYGTVTNMKMFWEQDGKFMRIFGTWTDGTVTAGTGEIALPLSKEIDTAYYQGTAKNIVGWLRAITNAGGNGGSAAHRIGFDGTTTDKVWLSSSSSGDVAGGTFQKTGVNSAISTSDTINIDITVPIVNWSATTQLMDL